MKPQPSFILLASVVIAGSLLLGCEGGIEQIAPGVPIENELIAAYVDPVKPLPGADPADRDLLPILDGDAQDKEWQIAQPLYVYVSGENGFGGPGFYVELRAIWSDEKRIDPSKLKNHLYMLVRYGDDTFDIFPDYWRYARPGALGLVPSPVPQSPGSGACDSVVVSGQNWYVENANSMEDQVSIAFQIEPASDNLGTFDEIGCQVACHMGGDKAFGGVPSGKLDIWTWRAGRTNAQESTVYPDLTQVDDKTGRPGTLYRTYDPSPAWPGYMEDMWADAAGLHNDHAEGISYFNKSGYTGQLYTRNESIRFSRDGLPIPSHITELVRDVRVGTGGEVPEVVPANGGLPTEFYLWGPTAKVFLACDSLATSRISANYQKWSDRLTPGKTDVMPGYLLWIPNGSAADVRAKGDFVENQAKRFPVWAIEIRRPMETGHPDDVALDPNEEYTFAIAIFNRSSRIHSGSGPLKLRFQPSKYQKPQTPEAGL